MPTQTPITAEQFWLMPDDGQRRELVQGKVAMVAPAGGGHGRAVLTGEDVVSGFSVPMAQIFA